MVTYLAILTLALDSTAELALKLVAGSIRPPATRRPCREIRLAQTSCLGPGCCSGSCVKGK